MSNTVQSLWQHQEPPLKTMSPDEIRRRADQALSEDRKHKLVGVLTAGILVGCFGLFFFASQSVMGKIGGAVGIGAGISLAYRAYRLMGTHPLLPSACGIDAYRRILQREEKALTICWQTMLVVQLGVALQLVADTGRGARLAVTLLATIAPVIVVAALTRAKAKAYGRRAHALDLGLS